MKFLYRLREKYEYHRFRFLLYLKEREEISNIIRTTVKYLEELMIKVNSYIYSSKTDYQKNFYTVEYCFLKDTFESIIKIWNRIVRFPSYTEIYDLIKDLKFYNNKLRIYIRRSLDDYYYQNRDFFYQHLYDSNHRLDIIKRCLDNDNLIDYLK